MTLHQNVQIFNGSSQSHDLDSWVNLQNHGGVTTALFSITSLTLDLTCKKEEFHVWVLWGHYSSSSPHLVLYRRAPAPETRSLGGRWAPNNKTGHSKGFFRSHPWPMLTEKHSWTIGCAMGNGFVVQPFFVNKSDPDKYSSTIRRCFSSSSIPSWIYCNFFSLVLKCIAFPNISKSAEKATLMLPNNGFCPFSAKRLPPVEDAAEKSSKRA